MNKLEMWDWAHRPAVMFLHYDLTREIIRALEAEDEQAIAAAAAKIQRLGEWEEAEIAPSGPWLPAALPSDCARSLGMSLDTLKRRIRDGAIRVNVLGQKSWQIHKADAEKFRE